MHVKTLILGAGLTGLSTAYHLERQGQTDYLLLEQAAAPGGLCASRTVRGFTLDCGGHLLHLHTPYGKKPKIAFQLFIYDKLLRANGLDKGCRIIDSVYSTAKLFSGPPQSEYMGEEFYGLMDEGLGKVLEEMSDLSVPFRRTEDEEVCAYCDFRTICGR